MPPPPLLPVPLLQGPWGALCRLAWEDAGEREHSNPLGEKLISPLALVKIKDAESSLVVYF